MASGLALSEKHLKRLVVTGRDSGTARFIETLAREGRKLGVIVDIIAQQPAYGLLRLSGCTAIEALGGERPRMEGKENGALESWTDGVLKRLSPDAVLTTVSGNGPGIDEAVLRCSDGLLVPSLSYQGYWGNVNESTTLLPDVLLVTDDEAEAVTRDRLGNRTPVVKVVGSLMAQALSDVDWVKVRKEVRKTLLGNNGSGLISTIMLQPLSRWPEYYEAVWKWAAVAGEFGLSIFAPHPSDPCPRLIRDIKTLDCYGASRGVRRVKPGEMEGVRIAAGSDIVVSAFSSSLVEAAYIASTLPEGEGPAPIYFLPGRMYGLFREATGLRVPPFVDRGCALLARREGDAAFRLAFIQAMKMRRFLNQACRSQLEMRKNVAGVVFSEIERLVQSRRVSVSYE